MVSSCSAGSSSHATAVPTIPWGTFDRPFSASSLWNSRPTDAVLSATTIPASSYFPAVGPGTHTSAAFKATAADGPITIIGLDSRGVWDPDSEVYRPGITVPHWPAGVVPAAGSDGHAEVVDTVTGMVHSFLKLRRVGNVWQAAQYGWTALAGRGLGDPSHYFQGTRATGVSTLGGLIRKQEVNDGDTIYRHALAMSLTFNALSPNPTYQFPLPCAIRA